VVVCRRLPLAGTRLLAETCEVREGGLGAGPADLRELVPGADALIADPTVSVDAALLDAAGPGLRVVANFAVGYDNVDLEACRARGVAVTNTPDVLTDATAELALALTLAAARQLPAAERSLRAGEWDGWDPEGYIGTQLRGATFAIVGMGRIGRRYAELIAPLAGRIVYAGPHEKPAAETALGAVRLPLPEALAAADVVSLHAPATPETRHLIGAGELRRMRPGAILVNTARGSLVDSEALAAALCSESLGAAGLDVYEDEPAVPDELLAAPRCVLLPHVGSATRTARDAMAELAAQSALAVLAGAEPATRVA
jgi:glyoxylate reductase